MTGENNGALSCTLPQLRSLLESEMLYQEQLLTALQACQEDFDTLRCALESRDAKIKELILENIQLHKLLEKGSKKI